MQGALLTRQMHAKGIKEIADFVSEASGGQGIVQDVFRWLLRDAGKWDSFISDATKKDSNNASLYK